MNTETQARLSSGQAPGRDDNSKGEEDTVVEGFIQQAYNRLKELDAVSALEFLQKALKLDYEHNEVKYSLKCVNWWLEGLRRLDDFHDPYEKGEFVLSQWRLFQTFLNQIGEAFDSCLYALRCFVFSLALSFFGNVLANSGDHPHPQLLLQIGRCFKGLGNYEEAAKYFEHTIRFRPEDSGALAELADVNALLGDPRTAKVLFREAFFMDPQAVDLWSIESDMIIRLRQKVAELGYEGRVLAEWIPVYGALWGIFSVRRELKPIELSRLKQSILALESESRNTVGKPAELRQNRASRSEFEPGQNRTGRSEIYAQGAPAELRRSRVSPQDDFIKPRLLNRYFRLIDHYGTIQGGNVRNNSELVEDTMRKIKLIDPDIHDQYRN
jgi:tetratricopeptide (TPR) repeat protein